MSIQESNIKLETSADTITTEYDGVDPQLSLRITGYDTSNMDAAIKAFKLHFIQGGMLTDQDLKILNNLYKKYM